MLSRTLTPNAEKMALENANVTALEHHVEGGVTGSRLTINKAQQFVPGLALWDVNSLIDEVLEP